MPPDFRDWLEGLGVDVVPIGPELRKITAVAPPATPGPLSPEVRRQMAARSVAERMDIPYVIHCVLPQPWLAADPTLAPWPDTNEQGVFQPGAWILPDAQPLPPEVEEFLAAGEPPIYFGFGSIRAPQGLGDTMIQAPRTLGRRAIVSRGWAELSLVDNRSDGLSIGEVNQQALFPCAAAVVHHGGAGTTTAAALAGTPQVVIPQMYDQHYWAQRVHALRIGTAHAPGTSTPESLARALESTLQPDVAARAQSIATTMRRDGAHIAALRLVSGRA